MPLKPGTKLGPYEIIAPPGAGGMGEVYRSSDSRLDRQVRQNIPPNEMIREVLNWLDRYLGPEGR